MERSLRRGSRPPGSRAVFALVRYNADGTLDTSFDGDGRVTTDFTSWHDSVQNIVIQPDQKIVAAGIAGLGAANPKFALARYDADGTLDATFSEDGKVTTNFTASFDGAYDLVLEPDGQIVAAGEAGGSGGRFALARYDSDGTLDSGFGSSGKVTTNFTSRVDFATGVALQGDGKIVAAGGAAVGASNPKFSMARYNAT
jgi:uncharacterized delta-60 repeat protein